MQRGLCLSCSSLYPSTSKVPGTFQALSVYFLNEWMSWMIATIGAGISETSSISYPVASSKPELEGLGSY